MYVCSGLRQRFWFPTLRMLGRVYWNRHRLVVHIYLGWKAENVNNFYLHFISVILVLLCRVLRDDQQFMKLQRG